MDEERRKRARRTALDQVDEERIVAPLARIESESDWDETNASDTDQDLDDSDEEFSRSDLEFLEDDHYYYTLEMEEEDDDFDLDEDDLDPDPDELSYEDLIALGERVGVENRGLSEVEIDKHLHLLSCQSTAKLLIDRCVICQMEYEQGEKLASLDCDHPFHPDCITKWLKIKKICPICNNEVSCEEIPRTV